MHKIASKISLLFFLTDVDHMKTLQLKVWFSLFLCSLDLIQNGGIAELSTCVKITSIQYGKLCTSFSIN